jgi:hypothetical protein
VSGYSGITVHCQIALLCEGDACPARVVAYDGTVRAGERIPEPVLPYGWIAIVTAFGSQVFCADHAEEALDQITAGFARRAP